MGFFDKSTSGGRDGFYNFNGVFVERVVVKSARVSAPAKERDTTPFSHDIGIHLAYDIGKDFTPEFYTGGDFKKTETAQGVQITDLGSAFKVFRVFEDLDLDLKPYAASLGVDPDTTDPDEIASVMSAACDQVEGREIFVLRYPAYASDMGKVGRNYYQFIGVRGEDQGNKEAAEALNEQFLLDSYIQPKVRWDLVEAGGDSEDSSAVSSNGAAWQTSTGGDAPF